MAKNDTKKEKAPAKAKEPKKAKEKKGGSKDTPLTSMNPDQMTAEQLEQAIKESQDPDARLKKIKSPLNVKSCLINVLILIVLTLGIVVLWCWLEVDRFDFATVVTDMSDKFGITAAFQGIGDWLQGLFGG